MLKVSKTQHNITNRLLLKDISQRVSKDEDVLHQYIFTGNIMERVHTKAMSRQKKVVRNSQHDLLQTNCTQLTWLSPMTGWIDKVREAVAVTLVLAWPLTLSPIWTELGQYCLNGWTTTWLKKSSWLGLETQRIIMVNNEAVN